MRALPVRVDAVLVQAVIAAALSFAHLHDLALAAGQDGWKAWAYPVSVDLLLVAAWRRLRSGESKTAGWCWFVVALTASLGANVATPVCSTWRTYRPGSASSSPDGPRSPSSAAHCSLTEQRIQAQTRRRHRNHLRRYRRRNRSPQTSSRPRLRPNCRPPHWSRRRRLHPRYRPRSSPSPARSPTNTAPGPGPTSTPRPFAPGSVCPCRSPKPSPPKSPDPEDFPPCARPRSAR